ncbi:hypothetical protein [Streptomyces sp. NPDC047070]|uniref:hypothetical protein n=1 Tax=Streptomyces sp. NPDC047070 TaxID=3154923 RepID=UPI00345165A4
MSDVSMAHPDLPDQPITVRESAVPHHQAAGWFVIETPPPAPPRRASAKGRRQTGEES